MLARFSTVAGEAGAADAERDVRGFALKFHTSEGNWDLVGNNTPVFFVRDAYKFPDFIHTQKRHPKTNLRSPTAMWDFWSLSPESLHQVTILMSDRGLPTDVRHINGYGSHTYSFISPGAGRYSHRVGNDEFGQPRALFNLFGLRPAPTPLKASQPQWAACPTSSSSANSRPRYGGVSNYSSLIAMISIESRLMNLTAPVHVRSGRNLRLVSFNRSCSLCRPFSTNSSPGMIEPFFRWTVTGTLSLVKRVAPNLYWESFNMGASLRRRSDDCSAESLLNSHAAEGFEGVVREVYIA